MISFVILSIIYKDQIILYLVDKTDNPQITIRAHFEGINRHNPTVVRSTLHESIVYKNNSYSFDDVEEWKILSLNKDSIKTQKYLYELKYFQKDRFKSTPYAVAVCQVKYYLKLKPLDETAIRFDGTLEDIQGYGIWYYYLVKETRSSPWRIVDHGFI